MSWVSAAAWASAIVAVCITFGTLVYRIRKGAKAEVRADAAEQGLKVKDAQLGIATDRPRDADDLVRRLRREGL